MEIIAFEPGMAAAVARCYGELVRPAPYCAPVGGERFADLRRLERGPLREEAVMVAREGGEVVGFVHTAIIPPATEEWHLKGEPGVIRFLSYRPGERPVGKALLEAAEEWLRGRGRTEVVAGSGTYLYPFYHLPFAHISERIAHLPPLLGMAGYAVQDSEVFFSWPDFEVPAVPTPDLEVEIVAERREQIDSFGPGVVVEPRRGEEVVGVCKIVWLGSEAWRPELKGWCFCTYLQVEEPLRGKGLGKHLLARGLAEAREAGMRHAMISTDWDNHRAALCYTNIGYRFLDRTFSFRKELRAGQ